MLDVRKEIPIHNITLAHTMGGEVSGTIDESIRHAITRLAHIHFVTTPGCKDRLLRWGEEPERVYQVGCPSMDLLGGDLSIDDSFYQRNGGVGHPIDLRRPFLLVLQHPVTTEFDTAAANMAQLVAAVEELRMPTLWFWPNGDAGSDEMSRELRKYRERTDPKHVYFIKSTSPEDFARLLNTCACLVGNTSSGIREGSFLGTPFVCVGTRQQNREQAQNTMNVGYDHREIVAAIKRQLAHGRYAPSMIYGDGRAGERIAELLATVDVGLQKRLTY